MDWKAYYAVRGQKMPELDAFGTAVIGRLAAMERSQGWLARRVGRSPAAMSLYIKGRRPWPSEVRAVVCALLDIKAEQVAA